MSITDSRPHAVTLNDDIIREILGYLAISTGPIQTSSINLDEDMKTSRKFLYNSALVSRAFTSAALDLLWRTMSSIQPLMKLLPMVRREWLSGHYYHSVTHNARELDPGLNRFIHYAEKVQVFCYSAQDGPDLGLGWMFFHTLKGHPETPSPLLPKLQTLYVSSLSADGDHAVLFNILSTSLRFVRVCSWAGSHPQTIRAFMTCLLTQAHDLHHFQVDDQDKMPLSIQNQVLSFRKLRNLRLTSLDRDIYWPTCALDELPNLMSLTLDIPSERPMPGSRIPCRSMEILFITSPFPLLLKLLNALESPNICEVHLNSSGISYTEGDAPLINAVAKWSSCLLSLTITTESFPPKIFRSAHWPLVRLEHLQVLQVRAGGQIPDLSEMDCWELARSFPNIRNLSYPLSCLVSFGTLLTLVFLCPNLHFLQVGVDTASPVDVFETTPVFPNNLQTISVGDTTVNDHFVLTRSLMTSFPNLTDIISPSPTWNSVNDLLRFVRSFNRAKSQTISDEDSRKVRNKILSTDECLL
ncbi:hypothetical protein BDN72DRAFT_443450 [Pluteus cervinus]|uniref:Uncharacterized protein n=1 Tax=Pluteus cervinus TaxID=181527 RepID=A0ACD3BB33_9AGAR|nr:hypothetical protein BDN72DRAFT_443450 [Pluteus cervinus]